MTELLELANGKSRVGLVPTLGGGIAYFDALLAGGASPVLRGWNGLEHPTALACNVLVPFSNRISGGGFPFEGRLIALPCNVEGQEFPIHGDGLLRAWEVAEADKSSAHLRLSDGEIGEFQYDASLHYRLEDNRLECKLSVTNTGARLPFGGGFHPWLHRTAETRLAFEAGGVWLEDNRHLPTEHLNIPDTPSWDFAQPRPLPDHLINNAFTGWQGTAVCDQPAHGLRVLIDTQEMDIAIVYSPGRNANFFCFEPVSHAVDAANQSGQPGLKVLDQGQSLSLTMTIAWQAL